MYTEYRQQWGGKGSKMKTRETIVVQDIVLVSCAFSIPQVPSTSCSTCIGSRNCPLCVCVCECVCHNPALSYAWRDTDTVATSCRHCFQQTISLFTPTDQTCPVQLPYTLHVQHRYLKRCISASVTSCFCLSLNFFSSLLLGFHCLRILQPSPFCLRGGERQLLKALPEVGTSTNTAVA